MMKRWLVLLLMPLTGCPVLAPSAPSALDAATAIGPPSSAAASEFNGIAGKITNLAAGIDNTAVEIILNKAAALHNLQIGLQQINGAAGMVSPITIIGTTTPISGPAPSPSPPATLP